MKNTSMSHRLWIITFLFGMLALGLGLCYLQMENALNNDIQARLRQAITSLDVTFSHAEDAANRAAPYGGKPCDDTVLTGLRTLVATIPDVRTVNLVTGNEIYCTSVFGGKKFKINRADYGDKSLRLLSGSKMTPNHALIVYSTRDNQGNIILISVDGYYLYNILNVLDSSFHLYLNVGEQVLDRKGSVITTQGITRPESLQSDQYKYSIVVDRADISGFSTFLRYEQNSIIVIVIASLLLTFLFRNYLQYRGTIEFMLKKGVMLKQLKPYIQPIVEGKTGRVIGGEVLVRWQHPKLGFIPPDKFIPLAEQSGLIKQITALCFNDVIEQLRQRPQGDSSPLFICFNTSSVNFQDNDIVTLCDQFIDKLKDCNVNLVLEITERSSIDNTLQTSAVTDKLRGMGVAFSLDDFGTGYANYNYLHQFKPEFIKIDKVFTFNIETNEASAMVVKNMVNLAQKFNCKIIAEGIEDRGQFTLLREMGIRAYQGYYFSKPVTATEYMHLIGKHLPLS